MADPFANHASALDSPARSAFAITPHATDPLPTVTRGIYIGGGGDLTVRLVGDSVDQTFAAVPQGSLFPYCISHVRSTSTASLLIGLV